MSFEKQFQLISYLAVFCGFFALWVSGTFGLVENVLFVTVMLLAWRLEQSRWQISERMGTMLIVAALPIYYLLWRFRFFDLSNTEMMLPGILARLILSLTSIKLLQKKSDRDWMFLYLMAFFELLFAAGLSISIGYLIAFGAFIFVMACTVIVFQIRKTTSSIAERSSAKTAKPTGPSGIGLPLRRAVTVSAAMIILISAVAVPTFFLLPRVSGAGIGGNIDRVSTVSGFSDSVRLGGVGRIEQNDAVVMRVRIENELPEDIYWRGMALDTFDGQYWSRSKTALREPKTRNDRDLFQVDVARRQEGLTLQTIFLEPLDSPVIFGLYRMIGIQGNFNVLFRDAEGSITFQRTGERISYKVLSDTAKPAVEKLRSDRSPYSVELANYLQLPKNLDKRISDLADTISESSSNRYDTAAATERYLRNAYGYTLDLKAGGSDPLSDFLFNVREGHCEYFATAMAVMLRTRGIATRVVNGFQRGEYNDTADVYVVRQRNAHSWVEVYFPENDSWVTFDPTPAAGQNNGGSVAGISDRIRKYMEAVETFWIQYFVAFDNQEQRSLFVSVRNGVSDYQTGLSSGWNILQAQIIDWWKRVRGDEGPRSSLGSLGWAALMLALFGMALVAVVWLYRKIVKLKVWRVLWNRVFARQTESIVEFYDRMQRILESKGLSRPKHQTPLEFAFEIGMPEALNLTKRYNSVRFGNERLSGSDAELIENWLAKLERDSIVKAREPAVG